MRYLLITNQPEEARTALAVGIRRIMVDLEVKGKKERQHHKDTFISTHSMKDIPAVRAAIPKGDLLVRINPYHEDTAREIEQVIAMGAEYIMLPMFRTVKEVVAVQELIANRAVLIPLFEHIDALRIAKEVVQAVPLQEAYLGLNDLHISLNQSFVFETLLGTDVEDFASLMQEHDIIFGVGGIGAPGANVPIPAEMLMKEFARLGSTRVILSRAFKQAAIGKAAMQQAVTALNGLYEAACIRSKTQQDKDHADLLQAIRKAVSS